MKIAQVTQVYGGSTGGIERVVEELVRRFCRDHEVHVYAQRIADQADLPVRFHRVPRVGGRWSVNLLGCFLLSRFCLRPNDYDIVHLHTPCAFRGGVVTCHGVPRGGLAAIARLPDAVRRKVRFRQVRRFIWTSPISEYNYRRGRHKRVIAISSQIAEELVSICRTPREKISVVPNGVDVERFARLSKPRAREELGQRFGISPEEFLFLFVGNFFERKGMRSLLPAFARVADPLARLVVVGNDSSPQNVWAKQTCAELGISRRVLFTGIQHDVETFYAASDCFVFPSLYEPFGLVLLEAMACGLPVIMGPTGIAGEIIRDGYNGLVVSSVVNIDELADRMGALLQDRKLAATLGTRAKATAAEFSWDRAAEKTMQVYRQVLEEQEQSG